MPQCRRTFLFAARRAKFHTRMQGIACRGDRVQGDRVQGDRVQGIAAQPHSAGVGGCTMLPS